MGILPKDIGKFLRQLRIEKRMTQLTLAQKIGIKNVQISQYENGRVIPSFERIVQFSVVLDFSLDSFSPILYRHWQKTENRQIGTTPFAQLVSDARKKLHLTLLEVAQFVGVSQEMIRYYEVGTYQPATYEKALLLAKILLIDEQQMHVVYTRHRRRTMIIQGKKWCSAGKHMVPIHLFHKSMRLKTGLHSYCKICRKKKRKEK